jgi:hypothetical protein
MNKLTVFAVLSALALGGCQFSLPSNAAPTAAVDVVGTTNALIQTGQAQTLTAQPSPTTVPPTFTFTPVLAEASPTPTLVADATHTPVPDLTTTAFTPTSVPTATGGAATATATSALSQATASPTLGIRTYGTLPPLNRPYTQATLINRSKAEAYISLQIETDQGYTIIEYPVKKFVRVNIPTGDYTYVVWVGGRQFVGYFHASDLHEPVITIFKDKIVIK